ncbi:MAG: YggT family protein [Alphaproteobacteria bacterium]|nr:YggT family protein [Alphaproteobacteria bacterium]
MYDLLVALYTYFLSPLITLIFFILLAYVIFGWLVVGGVVSMHNPTARQIYQMLASVIEPMARPIRRVVPPLGQLDLSIFVLALGLLFIQDWLLPTLISAFR